MFYINKSTIALVIKLLDDVVHTIERHPWKNYEKHNLEVSNKENLGHKSVKFLKIRDNKRLIRKWTNPIIKGFWRFIPQFSGECFFYLLATVTWLA